MINNSGQTCIRMEEEREGGREGVADGRKEGRSFIQKTDRGRDEGMSSVTKSHDSNMVTCCSTNLGDGLDPEIPPFNADCEF